MSITSTVKQILESEQSPFADRFHPGLEIQLLPFDAATLKELGIDRAWPIRIPKNAKDSPVDNDRSTFPYPTVAIQRIGWTGFNWRDLRSEFVVFDLDSVVNHKEGLDAEQLEATKQAISALPYVTVRRSKSGLGYHGYVEFEIPPSTRNHTEHARLAKQVLKQMSFDAKFDFESAADVVGGNAWFHDRKSPEKLI